MTREEAELIVRQLAVLDNRHVTDNVIDTWHKLIKHLSYRVAERACVKAQQDPNINWVEPKHVIGKARDAIIELNDEATGTPDYVYEGTGDPQPNCIHGVGVTTCETCCAVLSKSGPRNNPTALYDWAVKNVLDGAPF